jgi:hypothetical protein
MPLVARIRTVKPSFFSSYSMSKVPVEARYLFAGLFTEADDEGRMIDSAKKIAGAIFPHDDKVTVAKVDAWLTKLAEVKGEDGTPCIVRYETEGGRYIAIVKWSNHQRISNPTPSTLPNPNGAMPS